jgi:hypothetical protein
MMERGKERMAGSTVALARLVVNVLDSSRKSDVRRHRAWL